MFSLKPSLRTLVILLIVIANISPVLAAKSRKGPLRSFGDYVQIINPLIAGGIASQEKGFGHFAIIYGQSFVAMHSIKYASNQGKWKASKRPFIEGKKDRYDGMPSGHTNSAWVAASYVRTFSEDNRYLSIPLYITAAVTGYSRVHAKEHTTAQVLAGAALAEFVTYINSKLDWSNEYRSHNFYIGGDEVSASFEFRF
ncbi:MAG: phosphatase PAP2 family protein [Rickettsiaceae bacterium]|nr:phosphatase PAP2 family protein [Rickettsiaceae bacterium]MDP4832796.1 phosphatase PAP2 family protein [Rickettsiaceae bacterium]MDP5020914.1 phosphatase PAP2 family protein [Rickettsiaceae bacterium]MDP5082734.1 phosphatase PAP2 family protein [Rickettsiaceae bacterium]